MHRITLLLLIVLLIPDLYIYFTYIIRKVKNALLRFSYWIPTLLLGLLYIYFMFLTGDNALSHHPLGIGRLAIAIMLFAVPKLLSHPSMPTPSVHHTRHNPRHYQFRMHCLRFIHRYYTFRCKRSRICLTNSTCRFRRLSYRTALRYSYRKLARTSGIGARTRRLIQQPATRFCRFIK